MRSLVDLVFPPTCLGCGSIGDGFLCSPCSGSLTPTRPACAQCDRPGGAPLCPACRRDPPAFDRVRTVAIYQGVARAAVMAFKIGGESRGARALAHPMAACARDLGSGIVTHVPATRRALAERGWNPAEHLARQVAALARLPHRSLLRVRRQTADQAPLGRRDRWANLSGAFDASSAAPARVILVDDIVTTGATADACARALRTAGATDISVIAFARTP